MSVSVGDNIPSGSLKKLEEQGVKDINMQEYLENKKVVLFSVPGAFTPTCSAKHLPGFVEYYKDILDLSVDEIICIAVNDAFVMSAWEKDQNAKGKVTLLADGNGGFPRGQRFAIIIDNLKITHLAIEESGAFEVSSAENIIKVLKNT